MVFFILNHVYRFGLMTEIKTQKISPAFEILFIHVFYYYFERVGTKK